MTRALRWDLETDEITDGPPIRARVYERKADISADGQWLIYAAYGRGPDLPVYGDGYTVVSLAPSLSASLFIPMGTTYFGGGVFRPDGALCPRLALRDEERATLASLGLRCAPWPPFEAAEPAEPERRFDNIHWRLVRDGWRPFEGQYVYQLPRDFRLVKTIAQLGQSHDLLDGNGSTLEDARRWEWADVHGDEILFAEKGALFRLRPGENRRHVANVQSAAQRPRDRDDG